MDTNIKHTPGLWKVGTSMSGKPTIYTEVDYKAVAWLDKDRTEYEANAKLISAAPELLDCLQRALIQFERDYKEQSDLGNEPQTPFWVMDAKAAIKKATE